MNENGSEKKLDWMYKGANSLVDREEYLLGRSVDKTLEQLNTEEKEKKLGLVPPKNHVEHECIPPSIRDFNKIVQAEQVDLSAKLQEDPLVAIKKREEEARRQFLQNPVQLKKLQEALRAQELKNKKKHKKPKGSDSDSDLDRKITNKLKYLKDDPFGLLTTKRHKKKSGEKILDTILMHKFNQLKDKLSQDDLNDILAGNISDSDEENEKKVKKKKRKNDSSSESSAYEREILKKKDGEKSNVEKSFSRNRKQRSYSSDSDNYSEKYDKYKYKNVDKNYFGKNDWEKSQANREKQQRNSMTKQHSDQRNRKTVESSEDEGTAKRKNYSEYHSDQRNRNRRKVESSDDESTTKSKNYSEYHSDQRNRNRKKVESSEDEGTTKSKNYSEYHSDQKNRNRRKVESSDDESTAKSKNYSKHYSDQRNRSRSLERNRRKVESNDDETTIKNIDQKSRNSNNGNTGRQSRYVDNKKTVAKPVATCDTDLESRILEKLRMLRDATKSQPSESSSSSESTSDESEHESKRKKSKAKKKEEKRKKKKYSSSSSDSDSDSEEANPEKIVQQYDSDNDEHVYKRRTFGLVKSDGTKIALNKNFKAEKVPKASTKIETVTKNDRKVVKKLTEEEKEKLRREMMKDAEKRDKERSDNLKRYREEGKKEETKAGQFDKDFVHKQLLKTAKDATVETRIKSNLNNIQRSSRHMDSHFSRRN